MRIRSSAAPIAAFMLTAGLLAGCTSPAPAPTESPTASTSAAEPAPSSTVETEPDLAALCEQLLPLETVQERFGDETVLRTEQPTILPDISGWGGLLRGRIDCTWGTAEHRNVVVTLTRGDTDFFSTLYDQERAIADEHPDAAVFRFDAFGASVDACSEVYSSNCQFSLLVGEEDWLQLALDADPGTALLPPEQIRERWDPEIERIIATSDAVLDSLPSSAPASPACSTLLSDAEASALAGTEIALLNEGQLFHDMSLLGVGGPTLEDVDHCLWSEVEGGSPIRARLTHDPDDLRALAMEYVDDTVAGVGSGEQFTVRGADTAWRACFIAPEWRRGCQLDVRIGELWMQVEADGDEAAVLAATERILANLAS